MVEMTKAGRRNIGRGYWLKVARFGKKRVAKFFPDNVSKKEARQIIKAHDIFVRFLREAGVEVPETQMVQKELRSGKFRLRIMQEAFKPEELGENYLRQASKSQAIKFVEQVVSETLKVTHFNREVAQSRYGVTIGADFKPDNVAVIGGKMIFIDTFSPHIRNTADPKHVNPVFARYFAKRGFLLEKLTRGYISQTVYEPKKRLASLLAELIRVRPELKKEFVKVVKETINRDSSPEIRKEALAGVKSWRVLSAKVMGRTISLLGKRKGMEIKLG